MKKNLVFIVLTCLLISMQSCESKKEKEEKEEKELAQKPVIENTPTLTKEEKRVAKEQRRLATIEKRNAALAERLKKGRVLLQQHFVRHSMLILNCVGEEHQRRQIMWSFFYYYHGL
jgi:hypothetical protein